LWEPLSLSLSCSPSEKVEEEMAEILLEKIVEEEMAEILLEKKVEEEMAEILLEVSGRETGERTEQ
jgi:hypothetical protein